MSKPISQSKAYTVLKRDVRVPLLAHIPHSSTCIPSEHRTSLLLDDGQLAHELLALTDRYVDELFERVSGLGGVSVIYTMSRLIVDPERFEDDAKEEMHQQGMGVIYTKTSSLSDLRNPPSSKERETLLNQFYRPYHRAIEHEVHDLMKHFGSCLILDCHSFPSQPLPYERDQDKNRPDICIGSESFHTPENIVQGILHFFLHENLKTALNKPFAGTYVPAGFYKTDERVQSIMIEINRGRYMDETTGEKSAGFYKVKDEIERLIDDMVKFMK